MTYGKIAPHLPGMPYKDAKSNCARSWSTVRRSEAEPHLSNDAGDPKTFEQYVV